MVNQSLDQTRINLSSTDSTPTYRYNEHLLGFETEQVFFGGGIDSDSITFTRVSNSRKTNPAINNFIKAKWNEVLENAKKGGGRAFDAPRARYETSIYDKDNDRLTVFWSDERYSTHGAIRNTRLPREYQAKLFAINGIPLTSDGKMPIVMRDPKTTDQGRIEHIAPAGFIDLKGTKGPLVPEAIDEAALRLLFRELHIPGEPAYLESPHEATRREFREEVSYPAAAFDPHDMRVVGIVYNHMKNFDVSTQVVIPLSCDSSEISLRGKEHEKDSLRWIDTSYDSLKTALFELAFQPDNNSGHLRSDVALVAGHLYGKQAYLDIMEDTVLELASFGVEKPPAYASIAPVSLEKH